MHPSDLVCGLERRGLRLRLRPSGRLRITPKSCITPELRAIIAEHHDGLVEVLNHRRRASKSLPATSIREPSLPQPVGVFLDPYGKQLTEAEFHAALPAIFRRNMGTSYEITFADGYGPAFKPI